MQDNAKFLLPASRRIPWNKGKLIGAKPPLRLLLGHTKIESTVRYLGVEVDDALEIAEKIEV